MRDGRSARAQTIAESTQTSPDWTPWVITGRSAARLNAGLAMPPAAAITADEAAVVKKRRRVSDAPLRMTAIGPPPSNHRGGSCPRRLTRTRHLCDSCVKASQRAEMRRLKHDVARTACRGAFEDQIVLVHFTDAVPWFGVRVNSRAKSYRRRRPILIAA